jgi:nicotinate-nucleotide pyrophosphorylase (carboxylating)
MTIDWDDANRVIQLALEEDLRYGLDATTLATVPEKAVATAEITPRSAGVLCGVSVARTAFQRYLPEIEVLSEAADGDKAVPGEPALVLSGPTRGLLTVERTALNLICHLSGIATQTARWVTAIEGTGAAVRDSRKTLPGLRLLQKYAVRCGGGVNHRMGLGDAILIKDNHVAAAGSVGAAIRAARAHAPDLLMEVEVDSLEQLDEAIAEGAELVLLDNFTPEQCSAAVRRRPANVKLEACGGGTLDLAPREAPTRGEYLAVGGLTHSSPSLDLGLDLR